MISPTTSHMLSSYVQSSNFLFTSYPAFFRIFVHALDSVGRWDLLGKSRVYWASGGFLFVRRGTEGEVLKM